nr:PREDICTED: uncharacterized protein LOC105672251 [Linepithema humile]
MLTDKKYGLSVNWIALHAMPSLIPQTVNTALNLEQFILLLEVVQDMLNNIERQVQLTLRSVKLHLITNVAGYWCGRFNETNTFFYRCLAVFGGWFTSSSSNNGSNNFLRVATTFTSRRLSDNTLVTPKIRVAPSCASSPGGSPGSSLPIRRHSSTGPQERRASNINLSPPTAYNGSGMPITSSSVPYLLSTSLNSIRGSRRPSVSSASSQPGGILQQVGSSMYQFFNRQPPARSARSAKRH